NKRDAHMKTGPAHHEQAPFCITAPCLFARTHIRLFLQQHPILQPADLS
ncbi:hypothetical protein PSYMO_36066, partial [Pseudomonas amygdali pv. mori str. 301020]